MIRQKKYKYNYNTYQKNAIILIVFLVLIGGATAYYNYLTYSPDDDFDDDSLQVSSEKIKDRSIKDINSELDNLLKQELPPTYKDKKYMQYDNDYLQYQNEKEEEYKKSQLEKIERARRQEQRMREELEILKRQEEEQRERLRRQQQMLDEQRRREYEEQQRQLERMRNNENAARQNAQNWSNNNLGQPQPVELTEEEKAAERMRKEMERQQKLDAIRQKTYTPEQQAKIDECQRREARKQAQLDRRRHAPIKSKHKSLPNFQPQVNAPESGGCEECVKY